MRNVIGVSSVKKIIKTFGISIVLLLALVSTVGAISDNTISCQDMCDDWGWGEDIDGNLVYVCKSWRFGTSLKCKEKFGI